MNTFASVYHFIALYLRSRGVTKSWLYAGFSLIMAGVIILSAFSGGDRSTGFAALTSFLFGMTAMGFIADIIVGRTSKE